MLYHLYELNQAALSPARAAAEAYRLLFRNPLNPAYHTPLGKGAAAALELFERTTRRYGSRPGRSVRPASMAASSRARAGSSPSLLHLVYF
jgi:poly-beta-hydroxyalkanoate depolymerase